MKKALLEINDFSINATNNEGDAINELGFAMLTNSGIITGNEAFASFWKHPEKCFNNYWQFLDQNPLQKDGKWARHNADIAYAQLVNIIDAIGTPDKLTLAVPNSFSTEQLSLLSGLIKALNINLQVIIDSNLIYAINSSESLWLIDMQLHQTTLCLVEKSVSKNEISFTTKKAETVSNFGFMHICNSIAKVISNKLITNSRYDPLHNGETTQDLMDQIKSKLFNKYDQAEIIFEVESPSGNAKIIMNETEIQQLFLKDLKKIADRLKDSQYAFAVKNSAQFLKNFFSEMKNYRELAKSSEIQKLIDIIETNQEESDDLIKLESLRFASNDLVPKGNHIFHTATHMLYNHEAWSIQGQKSIVFVDDEISVENGVNKSFDLVFSLKNGTLEILHKNSHKSIHIPKKLESGRFISVGAHHIQLIQVNNG